MMNKYMSRLIVLAVLFSAQYSWAAQLELQVIDEKGNPLKDAVVALVPATKIDFASVPTAIMDQRENMFVPGVLAIRVNTQVRFPNSDDVRHHVYSFSPAKKFELRLYHGMTAEPVLFDEPGTVVLGCNIHDSMVAHIYVVETEHFALTDDAGNVSLSAPAQPYQLQVHHPRMGSDFPESTVTLDESQPLRTRVTVNNLVAPKELDSTDEFSDLF